MNVKLRFVPKPRLNEATLFSLEPVHWTTDVGVAGDNVTTNHLPGLSVFPNSEWGPTTIVDGRSARVGVDRRHDKGRRRETGLSQPLPE